ncbi:MAG: hypothetical protein Q7S22_05775, partial [Candidatus Micrarchaeota archaeon]|nr:hypothetical protein [Candidatus Micrarchaeota archaeon]
IEANSLGSAIESYESILKLVEPEKSLPYHLKLGELCVKLGNSPLAHVSYKKASELSETKEQKFDYSLKAAEAVLGSYDIDPMYINLSTVHDAYNSVLENCEETKKAEVKKEASIKIVERADKLMENNRYISALNLFSLATGFETEELVNASLKEKEIVCELFLGRALLPTSEETLKTSSPKLYTLLTESGEKDFDKFFLTNIQTSMVLSQLTRVMGAFEAVKQEVGVNPARRQSAVELLTIGVRNWKKSGFKEAEGIPDYFLFQTLAVAKDSEQMTALKRLLETKTLRSSKDARKTVMWYLEDNKTNEKFMKLFFKVAEVSSENTVLKNIATLGIIHLINPEFEIGEIKSSEELKGKITVEITISEKLKAKLNKEVMQFMEKRTTNELVKQKFLERSEELYGNGMLPAVVTLYSKYSEYKNVLPLVDIAFAAMVMGDFDKVKFPTVNGVATMVYLSEEQRKLLLGATSQLDLLEPAKQKQWQGKTEMTMLPRDFMDKIASARADFKGKIEDMKFHFKSHMEGKKGEVEETFAFTSEYFANIEGRISTVQKGSKEFIKLQNIRKLLLSMQEIEKIDPTKAKESEGQIKKTLNDMALATKNLFTKFYGLDAEHLESLQAKLDIGLVRTMLLEPKEELTVKSLRAYDSADFNHLILAGKDPDNSGSCQRYDGTPGLMIGLSGYLLNSAVKIIRVENQDGIVVGRAMLKVIEADGKPVLFMERAYYRNNASDGNIDNAIIALAKKKAKAMGLELMTTWKMTDQQREVHLVRKGGFSPYEYTDALGGEHTRTEHDTTITVSILSGKSVVTGTTSMEYATAA